MLDATPVAARVDFDQTAAQIAPPSRHLKRRCVESVQPYYDEVRQALALSWLIRVEAGQDVANRVRSLIVAARRIGVQEFRAEMELYAGTRKRLDRLQQKHVLRTPLGLQIELRNKELQRDFNFPFVGPVHTQRLLTVENVQYGPQGLREEVTSETERQKMAAKMSATRTDRQEVADMKREILTPRLLQPIRGLHHHQVENAMPPAWCFDADRADGDLRKEKA